MIFLSWIKIRTNSKTPSEFNTRHKITAKNILLFNNVHVKKVRKRLAIEDGDHIRVYPNEEREAWRHVGSKHSAVILLYSLLEEGLWPLEPKVV